MMSRITLPGGKEVAGSNPEAICFQDKFDAGELVEESKEYNKEFFLENDTRKQFADSLEREKMQNILFM